VSFAIHDVLKGYSFVSRDRIKPFYYKEDDNQFVFFGSEIKQLLSSDKPNLLNENIFCLKV
jgi:asparagine synthetase B (glutamine-hydrolysing)